MKKIILSVAVLLLVVFAVAAQTGMDDSGMMADANEKMVVQATDAGQPGDDGMGMMADENATTEHETAEAVPTLIATNPDDMAGEGVKERLRDGEYMGEDGEKIRVTTTAENMMQLQVNGVDAETGLVMSQEKTQEKTELRANLSNGKQAMIKVMPDAASERALTQLKLKVCSVENGCQIQLKEVKQGNETKAAYDVQADKPVKVFGLFKAKMHVQAQIDAETGDLIKEKVPWWSFLASDAQQ